MNRSFFRDNNGLYCSGGIYNCFAELAVYNSVFLLNDGGAIYDVGDGGTTIVNCSFARNEGYALWAYSGSFVLADTILWRGYEISPSSDVRNCCIKKCVPPLGWIDMITAPPRFKDADLRIRSDSPCMDSGDNASLPTWIDCDGNGEDRIVAPTGGTPVIDIGAYEIQAP